MTFFANELSTHSRTIEKTRTSSNLETHDATHREVTNSCVACRVGPADQKRDRADPEEHFADERTHCASVAEGSLRQS